ncbi:protein MEMO1 [Physcia stellaris]|nr:protein MEMO1 [Physcia stellaris]
MRTREASHAGSWYSDHKSTLSKQLDEWLDQVPDAIEGVGSIPPSGARAIIAPHAGYAYSGPAAAWAYKCLDFSKAKRVFLLGPSHHAYLSGCALSQCTHYETPLGDLILDKGTIAELKATSRFETMSTSTDEAEHSLEMHLPYIYKMLSRSFPPDAFPPLTPILVGSTSPSTEKEYGSILAPYLADPGNVFVVSSDFCHWGSRFSYTFYMPGSDTSSGYSLKRSKAPSDSTPIHESIGTLDQLAMTAIETGSHDAFCRTSERPVILFVEDTLSVLSWLG